MYTNHELHSVEEVCYDNEHVESIVKIIKKKFDEYFDEFIVTEGGCIATIKNIKNLAKFFETNLTNKNKIIDCKSKLLYVFNEAIIEFKKDSEVYYELLNEEAFEEYKDDPSNFKTKLRNDCPIIRATLNGNAKELDKYKADFSNSDANELLRVCSNLFYFAKEYSQDKSDKKKYESLEDYQDLEFEDLDTDDYTVYKVIGGGIKSHLLYKLFPEFFPNRSRQAIWSLWYLTDKDTFKCETDSEFLMIDIEKNKIQQNYFYPYELFTFYAFQIYFLLKEKAKEIGFELDSKFRYVYVDSFLTFIANKHEEQIKVLKGDSNGYF